MDKNKTIKYEDLPQDIQDFLSDKHEHYPDEDGALIYYEKDVLVLIANLLQ